MQICIFVTQVLVIVWCKENGIFTLKNETLKHVDFASEWRESRFRGLEFVKIFGGRMPPDPPTGGPQKAAPFHQTPSTKNLHSSHSLSFLYWCPIFQLCLRRTVRVGPEPSTCPS